MALACTYICTRYIICKCLTNQMCTCTKRQTKNRQETFVQSSNRFLYAMFNAMNKINWKLHAIHVVIYGIQICVYIAQKVYMYLCT